jgi:hypothetical protein
MNAFAARKNVRPETEMARGSRDNPLTAAELLDEDLRLSPGTIRPYLDTDGRPTYRSPYGHTAQYDARLCGRRYWQISGAVRAGVQRSQFGDGRLFFYLDLSNEDAEALRALEVKLGLTETCVRPWRGTPGSLICSYDPEYAHTTDAEGRWTEIGRNAQVTLTLELNGVRVKETGDSLMYRTCGVRVH